MTNDDVNHHLDGAFAPTNPAHQNTVAALFTSRGAHDLLPMMQLTDADRAANAARWDREHDARARAVRTGDLLRLLPKPH